MNCFTPAVVCALVLAASPSWAATTFTISDLAANGQHAQTFGTDRVGKTIGVAGTPSYTKSWAETKVGVNKLYSSTTGPQPSEDPDNNGYYVSSIWGENFTVDAAATGPVTIRFDVGIDGTVTGANDAAFNYYLKAVRGVSSFTTDDVDDYEDVSIAQTYNGAARSVALDGGNTVTVQTPNGVAYVDDKRSLGYFQTFFPAFRVIPAAQPVQRYVRNYADHVEVSPNGVTYTRQVGSNGAAYTASVANFMVLGAQTLCPLDGPGEGECPNGVFGTPGDKFKLSLVFTLNPGDSFFVTGGLMVEDLDSGTIDFGSTAGLTKVTAVSAANPALAIALSSGSGQIVANQSSPFVGAGVPEPASWAMLIAGFGMTGATMRRRAARTTIVSS